MDQQKYFLGLDEIEEIPLSGALLVHLPYIKILENKTKIRLNTVILQV